MDNEEFAYFLHGTYVSDYSEIDEIFTNGLINYRGNDMLSTMWPVKIQEGELGKKVKEYSGTKGNAVFVIKIPKYYLTPRNRNGKLQQIPLPIWKHISNSGEKGKVSQLSNELIYGVYYEKNETFLPNSNYSPVHNPNGLQFDNQQLQFLLNDEVYDWYNYALSRNEKSFEELKQMDNVDKTWDNAINQYNQHFNVNQDTMQRL